MEKVRVGLSLYPKYARNSPKVIIHISKPEGSLGYHYTRNHLCSGKDTKYFDTMVNLAITITWSNCSSLAKCAFLVNTY